MQGSSGECMHFADMQMSMNLSLYCLWARRWEAQNFSSWDEWFARLLRWRDDPEGGKGVHCNVPYLVEYKGHKLGQWLSTQRRTKKGTASHHKLSGEQEAQLQALGDAGQLW